MQTVLPVAMEQDRAEIVVSDQSPRQHPLNFQSYQQAHQAQQQPRQPSPSDSSTPSGRNPSKRYELVDGRWVQLTAAGVPRKKPGRKPGTIVKPKPDDGDPNKIRKPRKPRDPNAPPIQRKRKTTSASDAEIDSDASRTVSNHPPNVSSPSQQHAYYESSPRLLKREAYPSSMQSILNADPPPTSPSTKTAAPLRTSGLSYDPIRGNYDPVRETLTSRISNPNPYQPTAASPRVPTQTSIRSPSIASLIEPQTRPVASPSQAKPPEPPAQVRARAVDTPSKPAPPSLRVAPASTSKQTAAPETGKDDAAASAPAPAPAPAPASAPAPALRPVVNQANFTTISNGPIRKTSPKPKSTTGVSTPRTDTLDDVQESSILDFGKARPGEEFQAPTIVLHIPIKAGETNKHVNFMRLAEERYGWDALHPRLAANRDRKARIAAATASLEKAEVSRESGDEMSLDLSDGEASNPENGAASGPDAPLKPKKKRNFKEDQYDVDDEFVDDSELLWEAQAAASRDGFFVYSGPLVPDVEKPATPFERPKRGRGSRGGRLGRAGASRGGAGTGRGGGPGSRGGSVTRKPRITKAERLQREREKAERETLAQAPKASTNGHAVQPPTPSFSVKELVKETSA